MRNVIAGLALLIVASVSPALAQRVQNPQNAAVACAYNTSPPTLTSGWFGYLQCDNTGKLIISGGGAGGGTVTQGPQGTNAAGWWAWIGDGTNGPAAVKAASSAAVATDPSLVVQKSPNSPDLGSYSVSGATPPSFGGGLGCVFQSSYVTISNGQFGPMPCPAGFGAGYASWGMPLSGNAITSEPASATAGNGVAPSFDKTGKQITLPYANPENFLNGQVTSAMTGTSSTALTGMGAQAAGIKVYVTGCTVSNSHATQGTMILLQNGSGGATLWQFPAAPAFGGATVVFPTPISGSAATGIFAANVTTGSNTFISCTGYAGK